MKPGHKYIYYKLTKRGKKTSTLFVSFTDIAEEYGTTKGRVAGLFYRSKDNTIIINGTTIKRVIFFAGNVDNAK